LLDLVPSGRQPLQKTLQHHTQARAPILSGKVGSSVSGKALQDEVPFPGVVCRCVGAASLLPLRGPHDGRTASNSALVAPCLDRKKNARRGKPRRAWAGAPATLPPTGHPSPLNHDTGPQHGTLSGKARMFQKGNAPQCKCRASRSPEPGRRVGRTYRRALSARRGQPPMGNLQPSRFR
jgi:hypothetical protein